MAKSKKLNSAKVEAELRLLAAGACGCSFEIDDEFLPSLLAMGHEELSRFAEAALDRWFGDFVFRDVFIFHMPFCIHWETYATLAAAIVKERARLDAVKAMEAANATN